MYRPRSLTWNCKIHMSFCFYFPNPHLRHLVLILGDGYIWSPTTFLQSAVTHLAMHGYILLFYHLLQPLPNLTCINIRAYSFPAPAGRPLRSTTCFLPAVFSPCCFVFTLFLFHLGVILKFLSHQPRRTQTCDCCLTSASNVPVSNTDMAPLILFLFLPLALSAFLLTSSCPLLSPEAKKMLSPICLTDCMLHPSCCSQLHSVQPTVRGPKLN